MHNIPTEIVNATQSEEYLFHYDFQRGGSP